MIFPYPCPYAKYCRLSIACCPAYAEFDEEGFPLECYVYHVLRSVDEWFKLRNIYLPALNRSLRHLLAALKEESNALREVVIDEVVKISLTLHDIGKLTPYYQRQEHGYQWWILGMYLAPEVTITYCRSALREDPTIARLLSLISFLGISSGREYLVRGWLEEGNSLSYVCKKAGLPSDKICLHPLTTRIYNIVRHYAGFKENPFENLKLEYPTMKVVKYICYLSSLVDEEFDQRTWLLLRGATGVFSHILSECEQAVVDSYKVSEARLEKFKLELP